MIFLLLRSAKDDLPFFFFLFISMAMSTAKEVFKYNFLMKILQFLHLKLYILDCYFFYTILKIENAFFVRIFLRIDYIFYLFF